MKIADEMEAWVKNAEDYGDDKYGTAAELMREAITELRRTEMQLAAAKDFAIACVNWQFSRIKSQTK